MDYFSVKRRKVSIDDDEEHKLEEYFATYVPLSNLPTPPLSSASSPSMNPRVPAGRSDLIAPSQYLSLFIPQNASVHRLAPELIANYLARSRAEESTVALAACILDSLSSFFVRSWRKECEAIRSSSNLSWFAYATPRKPQLIVLGALAVAHAWLSDSKGHSGWWAQVADGMVEAKEIDATMRCILRDIDYDLLSFTPEIVQAMRDDIYGEDRHGELGNNSMARNSLPPLNIKHSGIAVLQEGLYTPERTPLE